MYQVMLGFYYPHENHLIHRDLKTSNILVNNDCSSNICDFGVVNWVKYDVYDIIKATFNALICLAMSENV